jgi:thiol:disulfide interchange protein
MKYIFSLVLALFMSVSSMAQEGPNATIDVFSSQSAIQAGDIFDIAIRQNIIDGWHTYWVNPGDSGEAMTIDWALPQGVNISSIKEPVPHRIDYDPLVNFGHRGQPIFIQTVSVSDDFEGQTFDLNGTAYWLVCDDICIPESQKISLSIPVGNESQQANNFIFETAHANMPQSVDWKTSLTKKGDEVVLAVSVPSDLHNQILDVDLFPTTWGIVQTTSDVTSEIMDDVVVFTAKADDRDLTTLTQASFVIDTGNEAYEVIADLNGMIAAPEYSLIFILAFAFIGGLILNLMPCVFPVLSMKALSLVKLSDKERSHARASGVAYAVGIMVSFVSIAGVLMILKGAGETIGWGFQLQNPFVVSALATMLFLIGLNLMGLFEISGRFTNIGSNLTTGNDTKSSFFTGVLATLVATPCTAPFMASAIGYALTESAFVGLIVFAMLGFGLAFPYLLLTFVPAVQRILPRPGAWMDTFKQALAFPMFASVIWLVWVLAQQAGDLAIIYILGLFLSIMFLIWFVKKSTSRLWKTILTVALIGAFGFYSTILSPKSTMNYQSFDQDKLEQVLDENPDQAVFVNMTAAWCITCLVNESTSLSQANVKRAFADQNILYMKGDWTNRDSKITKYLEKFGRNGVPLYVFYGAKNDNGSRPEPIILPQILTPNIILKTIQGE